MLASLWQLMKAPSHIETTEDGITISSSSVQPENASFPIVVTEDGMIMLVIPQSQKADLFIAVTEEGIVNSFILQRQNVPSWISVIKEGSVNSVKLAQARKQFLPIDVTVGGMFILQSLAHKLKQLSPSDTRDEGSVISFNDEHISNALSPMVFIPNGIFILVSSLVL